MKGKVITFSKYDEETERKGIKIDVNGEEKWFSWFGAEEKAKELFSKIEKGDIVEFEADKTKLTSFKRASENKEATGQPAQQKSWGGKSEEEQTRMARMNAITNATTLVQATLPLFPPKEQPKPEDVLKIAEQYASWILKKNGEQK